MTYNLQAKKVAVFGGSGMVGSSIIRRLATEDCQILSPSHGTLDLKCQNDVKDWFEKYQPDVVIMAAATVGGILANQTFPATFITDNLQIQTNIIDVSMGVEKLLFLGSSCMYPRDCKQPMKEEYLLTGPFEPTNEAYAIAKIAGMKMCETYREQYGCDYITAIPPNLYGPGDNYDDFDSHFIAALIKKIHNAKVLGNDEVTILGTGTPMREAMYVDDLTDALVYVLKNYSDKEPINVGVGMGLSIKWYAEQIAKIIGWTGKFIFDTKMPDGMPRKTMDISKLKNLGYNEIPYTIKNLEKTYKHLTDTNFSDMIDNVNGYLVK
jgi:GDP-L-fucose synthase